MTVPKGAIPIRARSASDRSKKARAGDWASDGHCTITNGDKVPRPALSTDAARGRSGGAEGFLSALRKPMREITHPSVAKRGPTGADDPPPAACGQRSGPRGAQSGMGVHRNEVLGYWHGVCIGLCDATRAARQRPAAQ